MYFGFGVVGFFLKQNFIQSPLGVFLRTLMIFGSGHRYKFDQLFSLYIFVHVILGCFLSHINSLRHSFIVSMSNPTIINQRVHNGKQKHSNGTHLSIPTMPFASQRALSQLQTTYCFRFQPHASEGEFLNYTEQNNLFLE